jgi:hypothetical protein
MWMPWKPKKNTTNLENITNQSIGGATNTSKDSQKHPGMKKNSEQTIRLRRRIRGDGRGQVTLVGRVRHGNVLSARL